MRALTAVLFTVLLLPTGCHSHSRQNDALQAADRMPPLSRVEGLNAPYYVDSVEAVCSPPVGWTADPLKKSGTHAHQVWVSPSGSTAYGVIHFKLPLPVGEDLTLMGFLQQMKKSEGQATLLSKEHDPNLPGIRFVAEGGLYKVRTNLLVDGWEGWAVYAGTVRTEPVRFDELDLAEKAREHTRVGRPETSGG